MPPRNVHTTPIIGGFEPVAPCKGNGISAQGKVNEVNDTLGPPPTTAFKWYRAL